MFSHWNEYKPLNLKVCVWDLLISGINPLDILQLLSNQTVEIDNKSLKEAMFSLLDDALEALVKDRKREGIKIRVVILKNIKLIENIVNKTNKIMPRAIKNHKIKVVKKFKEA